MPPPPHIKPENVLKRAQELIAVGQTQAALTVLHEHVTSKRTRNSPIASLEPVMLLFVELCADLRKGKSAKDGLYQYKNIAQNSNVGTIELVLRRFIELAEQKVTGAQAKADEVQSTLDSTTTTTNVEDLDALETPETILLATVSGEQSRDRTDRAIVTPWLKFLWETYRTVLEILKNNARLEIMYQTTALQAFQFCLKYTRKTEFRRLCELLRNHVANAAKYSQQMHAINLNDPDTLQRHLDTRFQQLSVAVSLELWQEAFRSVDDIHLLLNASKRAPKNVTMADYYEKLTKIFLVSDNFLFHAAAWSRYYNLLRQSAASLAAGQSSKKDNPSTTDAELAKAASFVVLSALSIPVISTTRSRGALMEVDEARKNKNTKLTNLLSMPFSPTRASLLKDALNKGLLSRVKPEIKELYTILEADFHPLSICKKIAPILTQIGENAEMEKYVIPLRQVILTRLFQQLSQVYESVDLEFVYKLAQFPEPFQVSPADIEKFIMNGCKKGDLAIRLNHVSGILTFDSDVFSSAKALQSGTGSAETEIGSVQRLQNTPAEIARSQLARLAKTLHVTCMYVDPTYNAVRIAAREAALARAAAGAAKEHEEVLARRVVIEKKKEAASDALARRQREEETQKRIRVQKAAEAERQRLIDEHRERERKRMKDQQDQIKRKEIEKQLDELKASGKGISVDDMNIEDLDSTTIRAMKLAQLEKDNKERDERVRITAKRIDHLERALRREEAKHLPEDFDRQRKEDEEIYERTKQQTLQDAQLRHKEGLALKQRLGRLIGPYDRFKNDLNERRREEFERRRKAAEREFETKKRQRIREYRDKKIREKQELEEAARQAKEEEERVAREAEEKAARDEERKRAAAERKAVLEEERAKRDEVARKQREREAEAEARALARKKESAAGSQQPFGRTSLASRGLGATPMERTDSTERPRIQLAGQSATGGWREREAAAREAAKDGGAREAAGRPSAPTSDDPAPRKTGGYLPPALRDGGRTVSRDSSEARPARDLTPRAPVSNEGDKKAGGKWVPPHMRNKQ